MRQRAQPDPGAIAGLAFLLCALMLAYKLGEQILTTCS